MDKLAKWSVRLVDLRTLFGDCERRRALGQWNRRTREIFSICLFTLCLENESGGRYLIGFPQMGVDETFVHPDLLFQDGIFEVEDYDIVLAADPQGTGKSEVNYHRCELTSFLNQSSTTEA